MLLEKEKISVLSEVKVIRSHRRTMSLEITKDGNVVVRAPYLLPDKKIQSFVNDKTSWIKRKQAIVQKRVAEKPARKFMAGDNFLFLGKPYPLLLTVRKRPVLTLSECFELSEAKRKLAARIFSEWYRKKTLTIISPLAKRLAIQYALVYKKIRVTGARTRWGSCSSNGNLSFSWRLIMAPEQVVYYVVAHELAHLAHHNHSKRFWRAVEKMCPDFKKQKSWLKEYGHMLTLE